jgi:hypothetical protein
MAKIITIEKFMDAIKKLPSDEPHNQPGIWYKTQKEHWLGWLKHYRGPGAYNRKGGNNREAKFAYNHIGNYKMLLWIGDAAGIDRKLVKKAKITINSDLTMAANAGAVRKILTWDLLADALWKNK